MNISDTLLFRLVFFWIIGLTILTIVFASSQIDHDKRIEKILQNDLQEARERNILLIDSLYILSNDIENYRIQKTIIQNEKDSLILAKQRLMAADWNELQEIKERQKEINELLIYLRKENDKYK